MCTTKKWAMSGHFLCQIYIVSPMNQCQHVFMMGKRKGQQCPRKVKTHGEDRCFEHRQRVVEARRAGWEAQKAALSGGQRRSEAGPSKPSHNDGSKTKEEKTSGDKQPVVQLADPVCESSESSESFEDILGPLPRAEVATARSLRVTDEKAFDRLLAGALAKRATQKSTQKSMLFS